MDTKNSHVDLKYDEFLNPFIPDVSNDSTGRVAWDAIDRVLELI